MLLVGCATAAPTPLPMPPIDQPYGPALPPAPRQADYGAVTYWQVCMACHGDGGQGLTEEWRARLGKEDMNCWQSKCHAANHPPQGFELPHTIPPVVGAEALASHSNALVLYEVIASTMPWWNPGSLTDEEAWNLTAYLLSARGALPRNAILDASSASVFPVHPPARENERANALLLAGLLIGAALAGWSASGASRSK